MTKIAGSGAGSIIQRHRSADPDPHQNVTDPQHWSAGSRRVWYTVCTAFCGYDITGVSSLVLNMLYQGNTFLQIKYKGMVSKKNLYEFLPFQC
jgi:hypothetical protein